MTFRLIYLTAGPSIVGRHHFLGRHMFDGLRERAAEAMVGHYVPSSDEPQPREQDHDTIPIAAVTRLQPEVIYVEGGLHRSPTDPWRFPRVLVEDLVRDGAVLVVADAELNDAVQHKQLYDEAAPLLGARFVYRNMGDWEPVHLADLESNFRSHRSIIVDPADMAISNWLLPAYDGVSRIRVTAPVLLHAADSILATGNKSTTGTMQGDMWIDRSAVSPWASVRGFGRGYVALVAGAVSHDEITDLYPDNIRWMANLIELLLRESRRDAQRPRGSYWTTSGVVSPIGADLVGLLRADESGTLEFKETLRVDTRTGSRDERIERALVRSVAGFFNAAGGTLIVGVHDGTRQLMGLARDMNTLKRKDLDGLEQFVRNLLATSLGAEHSIGVTVSFPEHAGERVCVIAVPPASRPVFAHGIALYVRDGNGTRQLEGQELFHYTRDRFGV
jgi:hypothetical protein